MKNKKVLFLSTLMCLSCTAFAENKTGDEFQPHPYFGLGYTYVDADVDGISVDNSLVGALLGYRFHENFGLDFRGYLNANDDYFNGATIKVNRSFSVLAKGIIPVNEYVYFYGMLGMAKSKATISYRGMDYSDSDDDAQYGIGMSFANRTKLETQVEWMKLYDSNSIDATGINLNIIYNF